MSEQYSLRVNKNQLKTISLALDIVSRLESGQLEWCFSMIPWKHDENLAVIEPLLSEIQKALTGISDGNIGIGNVSEQACVAYDLHRLIRYVLHRQYLDKKEQTIFDDPSQYSKEPLAKLEKIREVDE